MSLRTVALLDKLFPAHAGVIPTWRISSRPWRTFPRPRGGDPGYGTIWRRVNGFSPPTRG